MRQHWWSHVKSYNSPLCSKWCFWWGCWRHTVWDPKASLQAFSFGLPYADICGHLFWCVSHQAFCKSPYSTGGRWPRGVRWPRRHPLVALLRCSGEKPVGGPENRRNSSVMLVEFQDHHPTSAHPSPPMSFRDLIPKTVSASWWKEAKSPNRPRRKESSPFLPKGVYFLPSNWGVLFWIQVGEVFLQEIGIFFQCTKVKWSSDQPRNQLVYPNVTLGDISSEQVLLDYGSEWLHVFRGIFLYNPYHGVCWAGGIFFVDFCHQHVLVYNMY